MPVLRIRLPRLRDFPAFCGEFFIKLMNQPLLVRYGLGVALSGLGQLADNAGPALTDSCYLAQIKGQSRVNSLKAVNPHGLIFEQARNDG